MSWGSSSSGRRESPRPDEFLCAACGNTVIVRQVLPRCMMCGERLWERAQVNGTPASA